MFSNISVLAGSKAIKKIKEEGLKLSDVEIIAGASGAAKFLVLTGIDRLLLNLFKERKEPLQLIGSSIGAFRMAAYCQQDPLTAINKLEHEYMAQRYSRKPTAKELSHDSMAMLNSYIADSEVKNMLTHPFMKINLLVNKAIGLTKFNTALGLGAAAFKNLFGRKHLGKYLQRCLFLSDDQIIPYTLKDDDCSTDCHNLNETNFKSALLASGSIPVAMEGVTNIPELKGTFYDGGLIDYHLDLPFQTKENGFVLFPHFYEKIIPGWFDKFKERLPLKQNMENVVLVAPSSKFVSGLPYGKIPDRRDFKTFLGKDKERMDFWNKVVEKNKILAEEFFNSIDSGGIRKIVKPIETQ